MIGFSCHSVIFESAVKQLLLDKALYAVHSRRRDIQPYAEIARRSEVVNIPVT
jgi:hypothetical protein